LICAWCGRDTDNTGATATQWNIRGLCSYFCCSNCEGDYLRYIKEKGTEATDDEAKRRFAASIGAATPEHMGAAAQRQSKSAERRAAHFTRGDAIDIGMMLIRRLRDYGNRPSADLLSHVVRAMREAWEIDD
jgi:hypothetical protein